STGAINMSVDSNCRWSHSTDSDFVAFISGTPMVPPPPVITGPGSIQFNVLPNQTGADRTITLHAGGQTVTAVQLGNATPCTYTATANGALQFPYSGGSGGIDITGSPDTCASSISSDMASWPKFTSNVQSGKGHWAPGFTVPANIQLNTSTAQRTAHLVVT